MLGRLRFFVWLLALVAAGLASYILTGGRAHSVASVSQRAPAAADRRAATETQPASNVTPVGDTPWATADAVAFHQVLELVYENDTAAARASAKRFFAEYPGSAYGARVERLTGVHPRQPRPL